MKCSFQFCDREVKPTTLHPNPKFCCQEHRLLQARIDSRKNPKDVPHICRQCGDLYFDFSSGFTPNELKSAKKHGFCSCMCESRWNSVHFIGEPKTLEQCVAICSAEGLTYGQWVIKGRPMEKFLKMRKEGKI